MATKIGVECLRCGHVGIISDADLQSRGFTHTHFRRSLDMPMYYFDLEDGKCAKDELGGDFSNDQAAKQEASLRALNGAGHQLEKYRGYSSIVVRNDKGEEIFRAPIHRSGL